MKFLILNTSFIFLTIFCFSFKNETFAQTSQANDNLKKYWYYRYRLRNDYTMMGDCQGCSIIAAKRLVNGIINFNGDQTCVMGEYMSVLATEYQLLKNNGQDLSKTLEELYYLLKALSRLDETAEAFIRDNLNPGFPPPFLNHSYPIVSQQGDLNGFFLRDDVKSDFITNNYSHFNSGKTNANAINTVSSGFSNTDEKRPFESLDQVLNLMIGLSFVSKYVNDSYRGNIIEAGESNMAQMARNFTDRMIMYIKNNNWIIEDPVTFSDFDDFHGGLAYKLAYGFAEAANKIQGNNNPIFMFLGIPVSSANYHDGITAANYPFFTASQNFAICDQATGFFHSDIPCSQCQEMYKAMMLAALGNSYYGAGNINNTAVATANYAIQNQCEIIPLIRQLLHGGVNFVPSSIYENLLNIAPTCGPYNYGNCNYTEYEWSSSNRWRSPEDRGQGCPGAGNPECADPLTEPADYPGIDYMMLFNMYCLAQGSNYMPNYINYMDRIINNDFPITINGITIGNAQNPVSINAYNSITLSGNVNPNADVSFRAGTEINVLAGSYCDYTLMHIDPFPCSSISKKEDPDNYGMQDDPLADLPHYHAEDSNYGYSAYEQLERPKDTLKTKNPSFQLFPNPSTGKVTLNYKLSSSCELSIAICNSLGEEVKSIVNNQFRQAGEYIEEEDLSAFQQGAYFYVFQTSTGLRYVQPLILSK
jgi:hypothetical protein